MQYNLKATLTQLKRRGEWLWLEEKTLGDLGIAASDAELLAASVFDQGRAASETNILLIDGTSAPAKSFAVLESLFLGLDGMITGLPGRSLVREGTSLAISRLLAVPGLAELTDLAGQYTADLLTETVTGISDTMVDAVVAPIADELGDRAIGMALDEVQDILAGFAGAGFHNILTYLKDRQLHLSPEAKVTLRKDFDKLRTAGPKSASASFQTAVQMLLDSARGESAQKLILLRNPHRLDPASYTLLQQILLLAREARQAGETLPLSVMIIEIPPSADEDVTHTQARIWLRRMRLFAIRNALFATPIARPPRSVIGEDIFVGRHPELAQLARHAQLENWSQGRIVTSIIRAESGIGKSSLALRHLRRLDTEDRKPFCLTLACPPTVGGGQGAVQSLINSIEGNLEALMADRSFAARLGAKLKGQLTAKSMAKMAFGVDVEEVTRSLIDLTRRGSLREELAQRLSEGTLEQEAGEPFDKLLAVTLTLHRQQNCIGSAEFVPLKLLIDDLHWISEGTAAVILKHLILRHPLEIVVTLRPAEWGALHRSAIAEPERHTGLLLLALVLGLTTFENIPESLKPQAMDLLRDLRISSQTLNLQGFSPDLLAEAIRTAIGTAHASCLKSNATAHAIIHFLSDGESANSLMAVETFNLLADEGFVQRHGDWPLIDWREGAPEWSTLCDATDMATEVRQRLARLRAVYRGTYRGDAGLSLSSFAVFEEKLALLSAYFGDLGPASRYFLYLSAMAGAPFLRDFIERILHALSTEQPEHVAPLALQRLRAALQWRGDIDLSLQCEAMETTFALLRRVQEVSTGYEFRHALLSSFFEAGLDRAMQEMCAGLSPTEAEAFTQWLYGICLKQFDIQEHYEGLSKTNERAKAIAIAEAEVRIGRALLAAVPSARNSIIAQNALASAAQVQTNIGDPNVALAHKIEILGIFEAHLPFDAEFSGIHARLRASLGLSFKESMLTDLAIRTLRPVVYDCPVNPDTRSSSIIAAQMLAKLLEDPAEKLAMIERARDLKAQPTQPSSDPWFTLQDDDGTAQSIAIAVSEALARRDAGDMSGYLADTTAGLERIQSLSRSDPERWLKSLTLHLNNHSEALRRNELWDQADQVLDYTLLILRSKFAENPSHWAMDLIAAYRNKSNSLRERALPNDAITTLMQGIDLTHDHWQNGLDVSAEFAEQLALSWADISQIATTEGYFDIEHDSLMRELGVLKWLYKSHPENYRLIYAEKLNAYARQILQITPSAIEVAREPEAAETRAASLREITSALQLARDLVAMNPHVDEAYARVHYDVLNALAPLVLEFDGANEATAILTEAAEVAFDRRSIDPNHWRPRAEVAVKDISYLMQHSGRTQEAEAWLSRLQRLQ